MSRDCGAHGEAALRMVRASESIASTIRPRVFIVSDIRLYREGLACSLSQRPEVEMIGASAPSAQAFDEIVKAAPSVVLLDFALPEARDLPKQLNRLVPGIKVIAFAVSEVDHEFIASEAGIAGFVTRDDSVDDLVDSIRNALRGEVVCSARMTGLLFQRMAVLCEANQQVPGSKPALTRREREIATLVNEGLSNKKIARSLRIGSATVKNHVHNILEKLQVRPSNARLNGADNRGISDFREA